MPPNLKNKQPSVMTEPSLASLAFGTFGIYSSFLYFGSLQEEITGFVGRDGSKFTYAWLLQLIEAITCVAVASVGVYFTGMTAKPDGAAFAMTGFTQVLAKALTNMSLMYGLSFPVATLAKSAKAAPVMAGSLFLGGADYKFREYLQVAAIIAGTAIVGMAKKKGSGQSSSFVGLVFICLSLTCDGLTGGVQKRLKTKLKAVGVVLKPYEFMLWTNLAMGCIAFVVSLSVGDLSRGAAFLFANPAVTSKIVKFAACSACGQSFIFYTIAKFDPLVCTTVTTTRKIFSVLLSIFINGHAMGATGWFGIVLASAGILAEMEQKRGAMQKGKMKKAASTSSNLSSAGSSGSSSKGSEDGLLMNRTPPV